MKEFDYNDRDDEISQLFKNKAEKLEANPSFKAWDRLEHKLDSRRLRKRAVTYRYTSMVAAAVGLIALIMAVGLFDKMSKVGLNSAPVAKEMTDDERKIAEAIELHRQENALEREGIEIETYQENIKGKSKKTKQIVEVKKPQPVQPTSEKSDDGISKNNDDEITDKILDDKLAPKPIPSQPKPKPAKQMPKAQLQKTNVDPVPAVEIVPEALMEEESENYQLDEEIKEDANISSPSTDEVVNSNKDRLGKNSSIKNMPSKRSESYKRAEKESVVATKKKSKSANRDNKNTKLAQFNWIKGQWKDAMTANSYENWYEIKGEILGAGYVINGKDTTFTEYMKLYQKGKNIYFEGTIDASRKMKRFRLKSFIGNKAIFERKGKDFPNQVVITQSSTAAFTIIYNNRKSKDIKESQAKYLNQRNSIAPRRASRNLNRY